MILFAAGRGAALRRFLVDEGVGKMNGSGDWLKSFRSYIRRPVTKSAG